MKDKLSGLLIIAFVLCFASSSFIEAQDRGFHAGYIGSNLKKDGDSWFDNGHNSFFVGIHNNQRIIPMLFLYTALDYYQTGSRLNDNNKLVLHYISVPVGLKLRLGPVYGMGGFHGAVRVSTKLVVNGNDASTEGFNTFDSGAFVGAGVRLLFIGLEGRYTWGLSTVRNGYKNNFWQAGLTLYF
jgi:hypothetical protein